MTPQPRRTRAAGAPRGPAAAPPASGAPTRTPKERATFHVPTDLYDAVRDAVVALSGPPQRLTLTDFVERAFRAELARLERAHNGGQPFPPRTGEVRVGRPIGR